MSRARKRARIANLPDSFTDLKSIGSVKNAKKRYIAAVTDERGVRRTDRDEIANVFADLYSALYKKRRSDEEPLVFGGGHEYNQATVSELRNYLKNIAKRKCADTRGVVAESLKHSSDDFLKVMAEVYNDILKPEAITPESWKQIRLRVLFKKADPQKADNYRPITILPILYKLFSKLVCGRKKGNSRKGAGCGSSWVLEWLLM